MLRFYGLQLRPSCVPAAKGPVLETSRKRVPNRVGGSGWKIVYYSPQGFIKTKQWDGLLPGPAGMLLVVAQVINGNTRWEKPQSMTNQLTWAGQRLLWRIIF